MSEEEKQAIEDIKLFEYKYTLINNDDKKIEIILKLIEKQQKIIDKAVNFIENDIEYFDKIIPDDMSFIRIKYIYKDDIDELLKILKGNE